MEKHQINFNTSCCHQYGWLYEYPLTTVNAGKRMVLLHGAGVASEVTWTYICNYLDQWQEVLLIDLAGMGKSYFHDSQDVGIKPYAQQLTEVLEALDWTDFDLAGYSFGGLVALNYLDHFHSSWCDSSFAGLLFLIEPAMLFSSAEEHLIAKAQQYGAIASDISAPVADVSVYRRFLDSVSPNRKPNPIADELTMQRLQENSSGFAAALKTVQVELFNHASRFVAWRSPFAGMSFVGGLSVSQMKSRHQRLAEESDDWQYIEVANSDHSLVFTKPRTIAKAMNQRKADHQP